MGDLVVTEFVSLDGVMQAPGGEDFKYKGWSFEFDRGEDGNSFKLQEVLDAKAHLLGRVTYESFAGAWPERESHPEMKEFAVKLGDDPKYVVSSTLTDPEWRNTTVIDGGGDVPAEVEKLKGEIDGPILVSGSRRLVQDLLEHDLVDQIRLMVFPVVLGTGHRVFGEYSEKTTWELAEANPVGSEGVLTLVYRRA
jgi:dihydrofolate reductase